MRPWLGGPWMQLVIMTLLGLSAYIAVNRLLGSRIQREVLAYIGARLPRLNRP